MPIQGPNYRDVAQAICKKLKLTIKHFKNAGRFKEVYCVCNASSLYALKIIIEPSRRTLREIEAIKKCNHRNIAKLFDFGRIVNMNKEYDYLLEEYLGEGSLSSLLVRGLLPTQQLVSIGSQLIDALRHLDDLKLVHRDIKPDNILFKGQYTIPVLVDFGIVRDLSKSSLTDTFATGGPGTPYFASPEQLNNEKSMINWRADQFSLGVVLCYAKLGKHPYQADSEQTLSCDTVQRVIERGPRNPRILGLLKDAGLPHVEKMTRPWPIERYLRPGELQLEWASLGG